MEGLLYLDEVSKESSEKQDRTPLQSFLALISGIFTPILPVITAAGMIKAVLSLLVVFKVVAVDDVNDQVLNFIGDAGFYFLPVFLGASAARQFKTNAQLVLSLVTGWVISLSGWKTLVHGLFQQL